MSRVGRQKIEVPNNVQVEIADNRSKFGGGLVKVKGPKGELTVDARKNVKVTMADGEIEVAMASDKANNTAYQGLYRTLISNTVTGVTEGYKKELEIVDIGYKAEVNGKTLKLNLGYNHPLDYNLPEGIDVAVKDGVFLEVSGIDKQLVGETAAQIRALKKPEPYKGKGIKYKDEHIRRKAGKAAA